ncbi:MAG: cytochrome c [bacterium]|nr:cytochrome c [bacterium]
MPLLPRIALLALFVAACSMEDAPVADRDADALYGTYCKSCHGGDGRGSMGLGSSFAGVAKHWNEEKLLTYIADPEAYAAKDPRLGTRPMAPISGDVPPEARKKIVQHTLSLMD